MPRRGGLLVGAVIVMGMLLAARATQAQHAGSHAAGTSSSPATVAKEHKPSEAPATKDAATSAVKNDKKTTTKASDVSAAVARIKQRLDAEVTPTSSQSSHGAGPTMQARPPSRAATTTSARPPRVRLSWRQPLTWPAELTAN